MRPRGQRRRCFYVSAATGNDTWSGRLAKSHGGTNGPFATLGQAQTAMRASSSTKTVVIRSGTYSVTGSGLSLTSSDNGQRWVAHMNEAPVIDGGGTGYVDLNGATGVTFLGITFNNLTNTGPRGAGVFMNGSGHKVMWCTFTTMLHAGLSGSGLSGAIISHNTFNGQTEAISGAACIKLWFGSSGNTISHNLVENAEGMGINIATGISDPTINNNIIDRNRFVATCKLVADGGVIYLQDQTRVSVGTQITNNVVEVAGGASSSQIRGIYLDDGVSNAVISGNLVCRRAGDWAIHIHGGTSDTISNNVFVVAKNDHFGLYQDSNVGGSFGTMSGNSFHNNVLYFENWGSPNPMWDWSKNVSDTTMTAPSDTTNLYWSGVTAVTNAGSDNVADAAPVLAYPQFTPASTNLVTNPGTTGAVTGDIGSGGALPTGWRVLSSRGATVTIVGTGTSGGVPYLDIRFHGTISGNTIIDITQNVAAATAGLEYSSTAYVALIADVGAVHVSFAEMAIESYVAGVWDNSLSATISWNATLRPFSVDRWTIPGSGNSADCAVWVTMASLGAVDFTVRVGGWYFWHATAADYQMAGASPAYSSLSWQTLPTDQGPAASPFVSGA